MWPIVTDMSGSFQHSAWKGVSALPLENTRPTRVRARPANFCSGFGQKTVYKKIAMLRAPNLRPKVVPLIARKVYPLDWCLRFLRMVGFLCHAMF